MAAQPKTRAMIKAVGLELPEEEMLSRVAEGATQQQLANLVSERLGKPVSAYYVNRWIHATPERSDAWKAAKQQAADTYADVVAETIDDVRQGKIDPNSAKVVSSNAQWLAARLSPARWGDRLQVEATHLDVTQLHLASLRDTMRDVSPKREPVNNRNSVDTIKETGSG